MPNTWLRDRETFIATMSREGMALDDIRRVLRAAQKCEQGGSANVKIQGFVSMWSMETSMMIRKETGTAWYRVPTRAS